MRRLKMIAIYSAIFLALLLFFAPKVHLYYLLESQLETKNVKIADEKAYDKGFCLSAEEGKLYYDDLKVGSFESISLLPLLLFNKASIENFVLSEDMSRFATGTIETLSVTQHVLFPLTLHVSGYSDMGELEGDINVKDRNISLRLTPSEALVKASPFWLRKLKKSEEGGYLYETSY